MAVMTMIKTIKQIHPKEILLVKIGDFYHVYGKDSYILSYLMGYKIKTIEKDCPTCGFPENSLSKIEAKLENKKINYIVVDKRNNYDIDEKSDNKNLNKYDEEFKKAQKYINLKKRIDNIYNKLIQDINKDETREKIFEIEKII